MIKSPVRYVGGRAVLPLTRELVEDMLGNCQICGKPATGGEQWKAFIWLWCDEHKPEACK